MHMYSHQMSQLAPVPTPIPATVTNTNTAANYTSNRFSHMITSWNRLKIIFFPIQASDTKFNRVDTTLANSQLNSNNPQQQQQTYNLIPNFPFILQSKKFSNTWPTCSSPIWLFFLSWRLLSKHDNTNTSAKWPTRKLAVSKQTIWIQ